MPNITLSMDEKLIVAGRRYAQEHHTTLNKLVREMLEEKVVGKPAGKLDELFRLMDKAGGNSNGWKWNREDAYDV